MRRVARYIKHTALLLPAIAMVSCIDGLIDRHGSDTCDYSVRLLYGYDRESTSRINLIEQYVEFIDEYIFDGDGVLYSVNRVFPDKCGDGMRSDLDLPPGRYSVIAWGNRGERSLISDHRAGVTTRDMMLIDMYSPSSEYAGYHDNGDRLFYGYRTFSVVQGHAGRIAVNLTHAHLSLKVRVRWSDSRSAPAPADGELQMRITGLPSEYAFMPEYVSRGEQAQAHDPSADDYPADSRETLHFIPYNFADRNVVDHAIKINITVDRVAEGEFIAFRLRNGSAAMLSFHQLRPGGDVKLMNDIPLGGYFAYVNENLDHRLRQEYSLELVINNDRSVTVSPLGLADWEEGGSLGYPVT